MYKLVGIGGKLRGSEYILQDGDNELGRDSACSIHLPLDGISKRHLKIAVNNDHAYLEDLGSSNGTFVNGKLTKRLNLQGGEKIAVPNAILQLVHVREKLVKAKPIEANENNQNLDDYLSEETPKTLPAKLLYFFKKKIMPIFHGFNEEYEWRVMFGIVLAAFIFVTIALTIYPVLRTSKNVLLYEIGLRGEDYALQIERLNARALERKKFDQLDVNFLKDAKGVESFELFDIEGRIIRPLSLQNKYINDTFSIKAREKVLKYHRKGKGTPVFKDYSLGGGQIGIAKGIKAHNVELGTEDLVGMIVFKFRPASLQQEASNDLTSFLEALVTSALMGFLFFGIVYYLTFRPIDELKFMMEKVSRGDEKSITSKYLMSELGPIRKAINNNLQQLKELKSDGSESDMMEQEDDGQYVATLQEFSKGAQGPILILNSEKIIQSINPEAEDLIGIRESIGSGMDLMEVAKDQGFGATVIDLCDQTANSNGANNQAAYEIQGTDYKINVCALMGKDSFAKAFYITFVKDD